MDILELARKSGMTVVLDAKIGRQEYRTVYGSVAALERFAELLAASIHDELVEQDRCALTAISIRNRNELRLIEIKKHRPR